MDKPVTNFEITDARYRAASIYKADYPLEARTNQRLEINVKGQGSSWVWGFDLGLVRKNRGGKFASVTIMCPLGWNKASYPTPLAAFIAAAGNILNQLGADGYSEHPALTDLENCLEERLSS